MYRPAALDFVCGVDCKVKEGACSAHSVFISVLWILKEGIEYSCVILSCERMNKTGCAFV